MEVKKETMKSMKSKYWGYRRDHQLNQAKEVLKDDTEFRYLHLDLLNRNRRKTNIVATLITIYTLLVLIGLIILLYSYYDY